MSKTSAAPNIVSLILIAGLVLTAFFIVMDVEKIEERIHLLEDEQIQIPKLVDDYLEKQLGDYIINEDALEYFSYLRSVQCDWEQNVRIKQEAGRRESEHLKS